MVTLKRIPPPVRSSATEASSKCSGRIPAITSLTFLSLIREVKDSGNRTSPNGSFSVLSVSVPGKKFIAGEPIKPATNRLTGSS